MTGQMTELPPALAAWAAEPGPAKVIEAIRTRAERGHSTERGTLPCALDAAERKQVGRLLGVRWELTGRPVRLQDLAARLDGLTPLELAEAVGGPVVPRALQRAQDRAAAEADLARAREMLREAGIGEDAAARWLADPALPKPVAPLAEQAAAVWRAIPREPVHLAALAVGACGDAHALDDDRPLGRAVARLASAVHGLDRPTRSGPAWRAAWAAVGVHCNEVSSRVLVLNLPLRGEAAAVALAGAAPGEPVWLTLRSLSGEWTMSPGLVYVCENPTVVEAAADKLGPRCAPLVCTDGIASTAALEVIRGLTAAGCGLRVRADFDRAGFVIVDQVRSVAPSAMLWRFDAETYALAGGDPVAFGPSAPAIHEEAVLSLLLGDLATPHG